VEDRHPPFGVGDEEVARPAAARAVEVDPRRVGPCAGAAGRPDAGSRRVRAERVQTQRVGDRPPVGQVEDHGQPVAVGGVDEPVQRARSAERLVHGEQPDTGLRTALRVERRDGRELHAVDAERGDGGQEPCGRVQGALGGRLGDVEVQEAAVVQTDPGPGVVAPAEPLVEHAARTVHAVRQERAAGVRQRRAAVDRVGVVGAVGQLLVGPPVPGLVGPDESQRMTQGRPVGLGEDDLDGVGAGCPDDRASSWPAFALPRGGCPVPRGEPRLGGWIVGGHDGHPSLRAAGLTRRPRRACRAAGAHPMSGR
jgi:hypothetical protein